MADSVDFFVDNKAYATNKSTQSVADILAIAGLSADQYQLISSDGARYQDAKQNVEIRSGDHFTTEKSGRGTEPPASLVIYYKVNGEQLSTTDATLAVADILRTAGNAASVDLQQIDSYILENIQTGKKYQSLADVVEILNDDEFLAVHSGATPVALFLMS